MTLVDAIAGADRAQRRRAEVFRKGTVTGIDATVSPVLVSVTDGAATRSMPFLEAGLVVGDRVVWVDQIDPFGLGRFWEPGS